jgi:SIR2-like domain
MLNADDQYTPASLYRLKQAISQKRPLVLWVGAGASRWANLPSWHDSARRMRRVFAKSLANFPDDLAESYIASRAYPDLFQLCKDTDSALFNSVLIQQFSAPAPGQIYEQFIEGLKKIAPVQVVTTNVDLCLEQSLGTTDVIERTDLERCTASILSGTPFVAKLHGSISSIASTVFTKSDYQQVMGCKEYIAAIRSIFFAASVVFLGYGLQDEYVLKLITENEGEHKLFGNGPHFLVTSSPGPPENGVHRIGYKTAQHQDHRAALTVLNFIEQEKDVPVSEPVPAPEAMEHSKKESGFYISHFMPSGTHISGQALELGNPAQGKINAIAGLGFAQGELPSSETVAFHDLAVGLTCFDRVFLPLNSLGLLHDRATFEVFWALMDSGAIKFVDVIHDPFFVSAPESLIGGIGIARVQDPDQEETRSSMSVIRKVLSPAAGREQEGNEKIESLEKSVVSFAESGTLNLAGMVRDALLMPRVSQLLGYSDHSVTNRIPRWLAYPTLRFAHLVQTGLICNKLDIRASRVPFGGVSLLSAAFSIKPTEQTAFDYASFVMAGAYGSNLSAYIERTPQSLLNLIKFRESAEGEALRREVSDRLDTNDGTEFSAAIEGSLKKAIPTAILQAARNRFSTLMKAGNPNASADAIWADNNTGDASIQLWRDRSRELLLIEARARGVRSESPCLCGSGDRLRDCCLRPLR